MPRVLATVSLTVLGACFGLNLVAQTDFCQGWVAGFKQGWCYGQGYGCAASYAPPCPPTDYNGSTYTDGYNRGFTQGQSARATPVTTSPSGVATYQTPSGPVPVATYRMPAPAYPRYQWQPPDPAVVEARRQARLANAERRRLVRVARKEQRLLEKSRRPKGR